MKTVEQKAKQAAYQRAYWASLPAEKRHEISAKAYASAKNRGTIKRGSRTREQRAAEYRRLSTPVKNKFSAIKKSYGLSQADWEDLLWAQAGLCAVCCLVMTPGPDTCVDHDHITGKVRGLIHRTCNVMLGQGNDDALTLQGGADYLLAGAA